MCGLPYFLARCEIVGLDVGQREPDGSKCHLGAEVEEVVELHLVPVERSWQEVGNRARLAFHQAAELPDNHMLVKPEVQDGEAVAWIPPATQNPRAAAGQRRVPRRLVSETEAAQRSLWQAVDAAQQQGIRQELDEYAFGEAIDGA